LALAPRGASGGGAERLTWRFATLLCFAGLCFGQVQAPAVGQGGTTTRSIVGTVVSDSGAPIPGAHVLLTNGKTLQVRSFIAQNDGTYYFYGLSSDIDYQVRAQANGMTSKTKNVSVFDSHKVVRVNLKVNRKKAES
jgi:hypothetical protein